MKNIFYIIFLIGFISCNDFLDRKPLDEITPEVYFSTSEQLGAYTIAQYKNFNASRADGYSLSVFKIDDNTDVQVQTEGDQNRWVPGIQRVSDSDGGWTFSEIYNINYFFDNVIPKYNKGEISGSESDIKHYIGEMYFLRAKEYFDKIKSFGDFPIIKHCLSLSDKQCLIDANRRYPMNEVGRFILCDLDSAIMLMGDVAPDDTKRNRLTRNAALIFKSRVALYIGSWLQNFKGTAFVPGGKGWPGKDKEYNKDFSIDIEKEINFFLEESMNSAKEIAENIPLENNNQAEYHTESNPYVLMYTDEDLSPYQEVIFWRATSIISGGLGFGWAHAKGGSATGYTKSFINSFLCKDGLPIYASSLYKGDDNLVKVKENRDNRLVQFMKGKDEVLSILSDGSFAYTPAPNLLTTAEYKSVTGYDLKKGLTMSVDDKTGLSQQVSGLIEYRAAEAYLNYIEACYLKNKNIDTYAEKYWVAIRERAGVDTDFRKTISATDMNKETGLLSAYTAGKLVDATLYNIRRERVCELMSEGFRWDDLRRWRSMDQLIGNKYIVEGFKLWGEMQNWYCDSDGKTLLSYEGSGNTSGANVSSPILSEYLRPYQIIHDNNNLYEGYSWIAANYLSPIGMSQFNITSLDENGNIDYSISPLYQNPGWPTVAGGSAGNVEGF